MTQIHEINEGIKEAVANIASLKTSGYVLQETDYAIALALEFPRLMNQKQGFPNIKFGGCFIPSSQMANVHNATYASCKVGDLLVLVRKHLRYNAALLQMKKTNTNPFVIKDPYELSSLKFYRQWPEFDLGPIGGPYDIYPKTASQGALYCIIKKLKSKPQFYMAEPMLHLTYDSQMTFARFIRDAINWQTGRSISIEKNSRNDDWSKLIWDLIRQAKNTSTKRNNIHYYSQSSVSDDFLNMMLEKQGIDMSVPMKGNNKGMDEDAGISILFIDVDVKEEEQDDQIE